MQFGKRTVYVSILVSLVVALAGCSGSENSFQPEPVERNVVDMTAPSAPTGLMAAASTSMVKVGWNPNVVDEDLVGYNVYRLAFGRSFLRTAEPVTECFWLDEVPLRSSCSYAVTALDAEGNESAWQIVYYDPDPEIPGEARETLGPDAEGTYWQP